MGEVGESVSRLQQGPVQERAAVLEEARELVRWIQRPAGTVCAGSPPLPPGLICKKDS